MPTRMPNSPPQPATNLADFSVIPWAIADTLTMSVLNQPIDSNFLNGDQPTKNNLVNFKHPTPYNALSVRR